MNDRVKTKSHHLANPRQLATTDMPESKMHAQSPKAYDDDLTTVFIFLQL